MVHAIYRAALLALLSVALWVMWHHQRYQAVAFDRAYLVVLDTMRGTLTLHAASPYGDPKEFVESGFGVYPPSVKEGRMKGGEVSQ
jgi:hypothetical protein